MSNLAPFLRAPTPDNPSSIGYVNSPVTTTPTSTLPTSYQQDSHAYLRSLLTYYGLESLTDWAWDQLVKGNSPEQIMQELRNRPEFKQRFPAIEARRKAGLSPVSVDEILNYEKQSRWLYHQFGFPLGFYDSNEAIQNFISRDVSLTELSQRVQLAAQDMYSSDNVQREELTRIYGLTSGQFLAYILDPGVALPLIQKQFLSASLSATAIRTQFGGLSREEAEALGDTGVTNAQAQQGFSTLARQRALFAPLPGEVADQISRAEQIGAAFYSDATAQERIARRQSARTAEYEEGGQFVSGQGGVTGLGSVQR